MTTDKNKEIQSISYNHLNLPVEVVKKSGDKLKFTYTATGQKLSQEITYSNGNPKKTIDYAGPHYYENNNLLFVSTAEGRVVMKPTPEYQYFLKDHLGNNRMVLTTKKETEETRATLETAQANTEGSNFINYQRAVKINASIFDHTKKGPTYYSSRLSGTAREKYGLARSLSVMPGDKVWAEVFAKYLDTSQGNRTAALNNFLAAILAGTAPAGTFVDGRFTGQIQEATQVIVGKNNNSLAPKAYLNWLIFDRSYSYISGGFRQISTNAREYGQNCAHERLTSGEINITQAGYVYFYLSNENLTPVEVYFDDFKVSHTKSPIVQTNDYYPFGMTFNSYSRENSVKNKRLYNNGAEREDALDLNVDVTKFRIYDPAKGSWWQMDPLAENDNLSSFTPYNYSFNNPIRYNDPNGDCPDCDEVMTGVIAATISDVLVGAYNIFVSPFNHKEASNDADGIAIQINERQDPKTIGEAFLKTAGNGLAASSLFTGGATQLGVLAKTGLGTGLKTTGANILENAAKGKAFELSAIKQGTQQGTDVAQQVTIKANNGVRTKLDMVTNKSGQPALTELKASETARLTGNQKSAFPSIQQSGGTIVGNKAKYLGFPSGTVIPPTPVQVVRPSNFSDILKKTQ